MAYEIVLHKDVLKFLEKHPGVVESFDIAMARMESNPFPTLGDTPDVKPFKNGTRNHFRLRISSYRFLYEVIKERAVVFFYAADTRGGIYKGR